MTILTEDTTMRRTAALTVILGAAGTLAGMRAPGDGFCPENILEDTAVNGFDLEQVIADWGPCPGCAGDVNGDDIVDRIDAALVLAKWGDAQACAAPEAGSMTHLLVPVDNTAGGAEPGFEPGVRHFTFDLRAAVTGDLPGPAKDNCWTTTVMQAELLDAGLTFFQHVLEEPDGTPPDPALIDGAPALAFDTYCTGAAQVADGGSGTYGLVYLPEPPVVGPQSMDVLWFTAADLPGHAPGTYTIARITIETPGPMGLAVVPAGGGGAAAVLGTVTGSSTHAAGVEIEREFAFDIVAIDVATAAAVVAPDQTALLDPGGGNGLPLEEALVRFTNNADAPSEVLVTQLQQELFAGAAGYEPLSTHTTLLVQVGLEDGSFLSRVMIPFVADDLPGSATWGPLQVELTTYDPGLDMWRLAVHANTVNSPGYAERAGDSCTLFTDDPFAEAPGPFDLSDEIGDFGVYWNDALGRGFAWANVDRAGTFGVGIPGCWADLNDDEVVDVVDLVQVILSWGGVRRAGLRGRRGSRRDGRRARPGAGGVLVGVLRGAAAGRLRAPLRDAGAQRIRRRRRALGHRRRDALHLGPAGRAWPGGRSQRLDADAGPGPARRSRIRRRALLPAPGRAAARCAAGSAGLLGHEARAGVRQLLAAGDAAGAVRRSRRSGRRCLHA